MKKKAWLLGFLGAGVLSLALAQSAGAGFIQGTRVRTDCSSPFHVAVSDDGGTLAISNQSGHSVTFVDARSKKVTGEVPVQVQPESSVFSHDGRTLYVCNAESDNVSVIDVGNKAVVKTIKTGDWPCSIKLSKDGSKAYVTCSGSMWNSVDIIDTAMNSKIGEIRTTHYGPRDIAISPDGKTAAVALDTTGKINRGIDFVDLATGKVIEHRNIYQSANLRGIAYTPDGAYVLVTMEQPKNWLPVCEAENAQIFSNNLAVVETKKGGKVASMPLDEHNNYDGNPYGLAVSSDGKYVYIGIRSMHRVTVLDLEKLLAIVSSSTQEELDDMKNDLTLMVDYLVKRVNVGLGPSSVALSPDDKTLYAANYFTNDLSIIQTGDDPQVMDTVQTGVVWEPLPRGEPLTVPEVHYRVKHSPYKSELVRYGQFQFNEASWTLQGEYSCASCHYERGQTTGLIWDLGDEGWGSWKNTKYIRGGRYLPPFRHEGFTGHPDEIVGAASSIDRVCGRDPGFVFRSENFSPERLEALIAYIRSLEFTGSPFRNEDGSLTEAQKRGWKVFSDAKVGCIECHPGDPKNPRALFSDAQTHDVGTGRIGADGFRTTPGAVFNTTVLETGVDPYGEEYDVPIIGLDLVKEFDTPTLRDIYASGTYFHDGSAQTLMATIDNTATTQDMHGVTSHLSNQELQDLVEFMKAL